MGLLAPGGGPRDRLLTLLRLPLLLPPAVLTALWFAALVPVVAVVWVCRVATGRTPGRLGRFSAAWLRYAVRTSCYAALVTDQFPRTGAGRSVDVVLRPVAGRPVLRPIALIPATAAALLEITLVCACAPVGWFSILVAGRLPAGVADVILQTQRYAARYWAYVVLVSDTFPWFEPEPGAPSAVPGAN